MEYNQFLEATEKVKSEKPIWFSLKSDKKFSIDEINKIMSENNIYLPEKYVRFLSDFGGGYFGFVNIYSLDSDSRFYLFDKEPVLRDYLPVSDNGCGDLYCLKIQNGYCTDKVYFYEHETGMIKASGYHDILEYVLAEGLKQNNFMI